MNSSTYLGESISKVRASRDQRSGLLGEVQSLKASTNALLIVQGEAHMEWSFC
jgi:hypothetical protein